VRIVIEALGIDRPGGGRTASLNLLRSLLEVDERHEYVILLSAPEPDLQVNARAAQHIIPIRSRFLSRIYLQAVLPVLCRRFGADVVHFLKNQAAFGTGTARVVTVYDMTTLRHPQAYPAVDVWYWRHVLPRQYRSADRIVAISEATAADLVSWYQLPRDRIRVIPCGYDPVYRPAAPQDVERTLRTYGLDKTDYFLHVGNLSLKKNLAVAVEALIDFRKRTGFQVILVVAGQPYSKGRDDRFFQLLETADAGSAVRLVGHVAQQQLPALYSGATAFVFPSLHEGFGLAPLEAMACGAPVIAHAGGAVREVVGDAGLLIESASAVDPWSRALEAVATDRRVRERMRAAGLARAAQFTGERAARKTLEVYDELRQTSSTAADARHRPAPASPRR
jgi:glycosyltransferase involved in cell wall biosynthesis